ncbi:MAG: DUF2076 domain-containing protein [Tardiphaga sp.]
MTPQERQLIDDLFDRLSKVEGAPRDRDAEAAIADGQRQAPHAVYALVQTCLLQDEALKRANDRIQQLEGGAQEPAPQGGFLDSMRDALFGQGQGQSRGSVPSVRPSEPNRAAWNTGQVMGQPQQGGYGQGGYPQQQAPYGQQPPGQPQAGGGGSFLGTAAAAAAGVVGGSLLLGSIRSMMGGHQQGFGDSSGLGGNSGSSPWSGSSDTSGSLSNQAGLGDIGSSSGSRAGGFDQAQADADQDQDQDQDDGDYDTADADTGSDDSDWT